MGYEGFEWATRLSPVVFEVNDPRKGRTILYFDSSFAGFLPLCLGSWGQLCLDGLIR